MVNSISTYSNITNKNTINESFIQSINMQAAHYILTMNNDSLENLYEPTFCNKLQDLVNEILCNNLSITELQLIIKNINSSMSLYDKEQLCKETSIFL